MSPGRSLHRVSDVQVTAPLGHPLRLRLHLGQTPAYPLNNRVLYRPFFESVSRVRQCASGR